MGYLPPATIAETLRRIQTNDLVLPAIQREYVWEAKQVTSLFDSLMRGYPIGGFLSWKVDPGTALQFRFYGFLRDFSEFNNRHCPNVDLPTHQPVHAILDGQQRLTSLNVGLRGSYAYRTSGGWRNKASSYPVRKLYLNVLGEAEENEAGLQYDFRLLTDVQFQASREDATVVWFPVTEVFKAAEQFDIWTVAGELGIANNANVSRMLGRLWDAVHRITNLHFYEESDQEIERVLDIFIRVNSGGTVLSYSDLLLSIATAQWKTRDAREEIHTLVDMLNGTGAGFNFSQDAILKAGLVLAGIGDFAFRVKNFNAANMEILDQKWDKITEALGLAADLLSDFGLSDATLTADSVLIPVAFYVQRRQLTQKYRDRPRHASDRAVLRSWVLRSLIKPGVWGSGLDTLLRDLRQVIDDHGEHGFPIIDIEARMAARGKSLVFGDEEIEDILNLAYGRNRTFAVLAILFPNVDTRNVHHVDHVFPKSLLYTNRLKPHDLDDATIAQLQQRRDLLPNLQLLEGPVNIDKSDASPATWASEHFAATGALEQYLVRNELPWLPEDATQFARFFQDRRDALAERVRKAFSGTTEASSEPSEHAAVEHKNDQARVPAEG